MSDEAQRGSTLRLVNGDEVQVAMPLSEVTRLVTRANGQGVADFKLGSDRPSIYVQYDKIVSWQETGDVYTDVA